VQFVGWDRRKCEGCKQSIIMAELHVENEDLGQ